nr:hypothetical protein BCV18_21035 [Vibrio cyclitrophicus]PMK97284.1 hypothetical protein BCT87_08450 [Vibrio cyclitrophicus]
MASLNLYFFNVVYVVFAISFYTCFYANIDGYIATTQLTSNSSRLSTRGIFNLISFSDLGGKFECIGCVVSYLIGR